MRATWLLAAVLLTAGPGYVGAQKPKQAKLSAEDAKRVEALIDQLNSKKFKERERAMKELDGFGARALALLEKADRSPVSLEAKRRLNVLLWKLRAPARAEVAKQVARLIEGLSDPTFQTRETAMRGLQAVGRPALEQLWAATLAPDPETVRRAEVLIGRIASKAR